MNARADSTLQISFPASAAFSAIATVAASNVAHRLRYKKKTVKRLQGAVDAATESLGPTGNIQLVADWSDGPLSITLSNPKAKLRKADTQELQDILTEFGATKTSVKTTSVAFTVAD